MFALINTMDAVAGVYVGTVYSKHRTLRSAARAYIATQRAVKRGNGKDHYLPLLLAVLRDSAKTGAVGNSDLLPVPDADSRIYLREQMHK